ncbi:hypothetical protein QE418_000598 [Microbacterium testaceum]|uniref:hypothetical protein n=1 Tax=Microbacterium TaxID=33882 RepID=UPI0027845A2B|nr:MULTISPECIES: hypothetical protein [Microbacterium]MDQ1111150.1 hypothetical protein [Microbacterium testaceum]MDR6098311.1 hypothetical protein [Microbacterium sp. SORGH_AS_0454]
MPHVLRDHEYAALGRVAAQASLLDAVVEQFLSDAITHDVEVGLRAIRGMQFEAKAIMLADLVTLRLEGTEHPEAILPHLEEARRLMHDRNEFLHGLWEFDADANLGVRKRVRKTGLVRTRAVSADDMNRTAQRLGELAEDLNWMHHGAAFDLGILEMESPGTWVRVTPKRGLDNR